jgi:hypothetical protein
MASKPLAAYSESEEEMLFDQERGAPATLAMAASRFPWGRAAAAGLGVLGFVGVLALTHSGSGTHSTGGRMTHAMHLGSGMSLQAVGSRMGVYSNARSLPGTASTGTVNASSSIIPVENMQDGNLCDDDEEQTAGLCYKKCSELAPGYPKRTSAWTCCEDPCTWSSGWKHDFGVCSGFSVAGGQGTSCPHKPGVCLANEELYMGTCYEKCRIITHGDYPTRVAAASCCQSASMIACMNPMNDHTSSSLNVGGGAGDGNPNTPAQSHAPMTRFAESR